MEMVRIHSNPINTILCRLFHVHIFRLIQSISKTNGVQLMTHMPQALRVQQKPRAFVVSINYKLHVCLFT